MGLYCAGMVGIMRLLLTWRNPFYGTRSVDIAMRIDARRAALNMSHVYATEGWRPVNPLSDGKDSFIDPFLDIAAWCIARLADPSTARNEPELLRHAIDAGIERINGKPPAQWLRARQRDTAHHVPFMAW